MLRSVRQRLLLSSMIVSLAAILSVGLVTFLLVDGYFERQEIQYLRDRGQALVPPLEQALRWGGGRRELHQIALYGLLTTHVRVRVIDVKGDLLADSGDFDSLASLSAQNSTLASPESTLQLFIDDQGRFQALSTQFRGLASGSGPELNQFPPWPAASPLPPVDRPPQPPIAEHSDTRVQLPLRPGSDIAAFAELSDGPAFGNSIRNGIRQGLIVGSFVAVAVAAVFGVASARQVTKPLKALGAAAEDMAGGNLQARAPRSALSEFDLLAGQFNSMALRLADTISSLEADKSVLRRTIADASHEMRTPLTALTTFNELLSHDPAAAEEPAATFIRESGRQVAQLDRLTSDLLDLSRLEAGLSGTDFVTADLRETVERAAQTLIPLVDRYEQDLLLTLPEDPVRVAHDVIALERAITNILSNANRFAGQGGKIRVTLEQRSAEVAIVVQDSGPGISESEQQRVFDRFYRGRHEKEQGSGLGLSIAQEIARLHGGRLALNSQEGSGATFTLFLPVSSSE